MEINTLSDPTCFAQAIRDLARNAHQALTHSASPLALRELSRRIELLSSVGGDRYGNSLRSWLNSLGREVQSAAFQRAKSSRRVCIYA
jgi:hypothetical protein